MGMGGWTPRAARLLLVVRKTLSGRSYVSASTCLLSGTPLLPFCRTDPGPGE